MTLPASTRFIDPQFKSCSVAIDWAAKDRITVLTCEGRDVTESSLDREQVQSLRDQLSEWLAATAPSLKGCPPCGS